MRRPLGDERTGARVRMAAVVTRKGKIPWNWQRKGRRGKGDNDETFTLFFIGGMETFFFNTFLIDEQDSAPFFSFVFMLVFPSAVLLRAWEK